MHLSTPQVISTPMLSVSHSLAHRGSGATRPRAARWQPYSSIPPSATPRSSYTPYLHTPASSVSASPPVPKPPVCALELSRSSPSTSTPLVRHGSLRDLQKSRYVTALVDQAVKSLGEIWPAQDVPPVFSVTSRTSFPTQSAPDLAQPAPMVAGSSSSSLHFGRNTQLPSPVTPSTHPSPFPTPSTSPAAPLAQHNRQFQATAEPNADQARAAVAVPLRGFVQEILRRSKTSAGVLQTALCYIEAMRAKIPELVLQEKLGFGSQPELVVEDLIVKGDVGYDGGEFPLTPDSTASVEADTDTDAGLTDTIRVDDVALPPSPASGWLEDAGAARKPRAPVPPPAPLPAQPSPLLCPRRAFLAALVLASKFTQDKCYSNKAWARLAGLPPREIGRCERALGAALEWRLWVGKLPPAPVPRGTTGRSMARTRSESDVFGAPPIADARPAMCSRQRSGLSRSSTLPAFAAGSCDGFPPHALVEPLPAAVLASAPTRACPADAQPWAYAAPPPMDRMRTVDSPASMLTPTLSYSPASTASMGDPTATIRMTTFSDIADVFSPVVVPFGACGGAPACALGPFDPTRLDGVGRKGVQLGAMEWAYAAAGAGYDHWTE